MSVVASGKSGIVDIKRVAVLHEELATAQQAGARACFVAVLRLNLIQRDGKVFVTGIQILHEQCEHLFVGWAQQKVGTLAVFQTKEVVAVFFPAPREFVNVSGEHGGEVNFLCSHRIHLISHDGFDLAKDPPAKGEPCVTAWGGTADIASAHQQTVARDLGIGRVITKGANEECGGTEHRSETLLCLDMIVPVL